MTNDSTTEPDPSETPASPVTSVDLGRTGDRYEISVGGEVVGFAQFADRGEQRIFFHTVIDDGHEGQGLAGRLVTTALDQSRDAGRRIVPVCPYVKKFIERHEAYADITDPVTPDALDVARQAGTD